jgi:hypothetical protein
VLKSFAATGYDKGNDGDEYGLFAEHFGKIGLGSMRLTESALPYRDGDFCVELAP